MLDSAKRRTTFERPRAKGIAPWRVIVIHALRNALIPVITVIVARFGHFGLSGRILTENRVRFGPGSWVMVNRIDRTS